MGITIYYGGMLKNLNNIDTLIDDFSDLAGIMNWECVILNEDWTKPNTARIKISKMKSEITGHLPLKGLEIKLHPACETFDLFFDNKGNLTSPLLFAFDNEEKKKKDKSFVWVKTQFAPVDIHISIIKLLDLLKHKYVPDLEVMDEGGYWESRDRAKLIKKMDYLNKAMDIVEQALSSLSADEMMNRPVEDLARLIEEHMKKKPGITD